MTRRSTVAAGWPLNVTRSSRPSSRMAPSVIFVMPPYSRVLPTTAIVSGPRRSMPSTAIVVGTARVPTRARTAGHAKAACPKRRFSDERPSISCTTAASSPRLHISRKRRGCSSPSCTMPVSTRTRRPPSTSPRASPTSLPTPISCAQTLAVPAGNTASAVSVSATPLSTSFSVPSPPQATTTEAPAAAASAASTAPSPGPRVSRTVTSQPALRNAANGASRSASLGGRRAAGLRITTARR